MDREGLAQQKESDCNGLAQGQEASVPPTSQNHHSEQSFLTQWTLITAACLGG